MPCLALLNIGLWEMLVLAMAAVLLFGGDLPETARKLAHFVARVRGMMHEVTRELNAPDEARGAVDQARQEIRSVAAEVQRSSPFADEDPIDVPASAAPAEDEPPDSGEAPAREGERPPPAA